MENVLENTVILDILNRLFLLFIFLLKTPWKISKTKLTITLHTTLLIYTKYLKNLPNSIIAKSSFIKVGAEISFSIFKNFMSETLFRIALLKASTFELSNMYARICTLVAVKFLNCLKRDTLKYITKLCYWFLTFPVKYAFNTYTENYNGK